MERWLGRWFEPIYASFRIVVGLLFLQHGSQVLFGIPARDPAHSDPVAVGSQIWIGKWIEFLCGLLVAVGFQAGWAAFLASGTMAVAYWQFHVFQAQLPPEARQPIQWLPIHNHGEPAILYCFAFLLIAAKGDGVWSLGSGLKKTVSSPK